MERITIMHQMDEDKTMVINDNPDIYSSCKCGSQFHKFFRKVTTDTEDAFDAEKSQLKSKRKKHQRKKRFSFNAVNTPTIQTPICQPCNTAESMSSSSSEESASPHCVTPVFLFDNNSTLHPNLAEAQRQFHLDHPTAFEV